MYNVVDLELASDTEMNEVVDLELAFDQSSSSEMVLHCDVDVQMEDLWTGDREHMTDLNLKSLSNCCTKRCTANFSILEIEHLSTLFRAKSIQQQNQYLLDNMTLRGKFHLLGKGVCHHAIRRILGVSLLRLRRVEDLFSSGVTTACNPRKRVRSLSHKHTMMVAWLELYATTMGDKMPHIQQIHLPTCLTKKTVYKFMTGMCLTIY